MKYYMFRPKDKKTDFRTKKLKTGRIVKISLFIIFIAIIASLLFEYKYNEQFREFFDVKVLRKEISNENTTQIDISSKTSPYVYTYNKYITILDKNTLEVYTSSSKPDFTLDIAVTNPIYADSNRFLCIAEKAGSKVFLISGQNIIWQKDIEGQIHKINLNKNGYVAVATSNSGYKTIITLYNPNGEEVFTTYLPTTYAADIEISSDNKYIAIAELNTSGTVMQSDVRVISVENAKTNPDEAFVKSYETENKSIISNLKYQDKDKLICMYNDRIVSMEENTTDIKSIESNTLFADIELNNSVIEITKQVGGILKTDYYAYITNLTTSKDAVYKLNGVPKAIYCNSDVIAINYGTEIEIINTGGWLIRRYKSSLQEVKDIRLTNNVVAVIYKDKVEIINI